MKITKLANNKIRLKLSFKEWEAIGRALAYKEGLIKAARSDQSNLIVKTAGVIDYIEWKELEKRLKSLGWTTERKKGSHSLQAFFSNPELGIYYSINPAIKRWQTHHVWDVCWRDIKKQNPDLASFIYDKKFEIPDNFDLSTQRFKEEEYEFVKMPFANLPHPDYAPFYFEIETSDGWKKPVAIDYQANTIMFDDAGMVQLPSQNASISIRKKQKED